jgi:hypothetical protein
LIIILQRYSTPTNPFTAQNFSIATSYLILWLTARHKTISMRKNKKKEIWQQCSAIKNPLSLQIQNLPERVPLHEYRGDPASLADKSRERKRKQFK